MRYWFFILSFTLVSLIGCQKSLSTRYLADDELLLRKNKVKIVGKNVKVDKEELALYIRQKPNKSFIKLQWKNLWNNPLKNDEIENPAVILDTNSFERSIQQMEMYMHQAGYYNAKVSASYRVKNKFWLKAFPTQKAIVKYKVKAGSPTLIDSVAINISNKEIKNYYLQENEQSKLKVGEKMSIELLEEERDRVTQQMRELGYYEFSDNFIKYQIDTNNRNGDAAVIFQVRKSKNNPGHIRYKIRKIYVHTNYDQNSPIDKMDTIKINDSLFFIKNGSFRFDNKVIERSIFIKPGSWYNEKDYNDTYRQLANLQMFSTIKINYNRIKSDSLVNSLDVNILLSHGKSKSIGVEATATFREGFGANGMISFQRKNAFRKAEIIDVILSGGFENLKSSVDDEFILGVNIGPTFKLRFPGFMFFPKYSEKLDYRNAPKSGLTVRYNYQRRVDYTRYLSAVSLDYEWNKGRKVKHEISPLDLSFSLITKGSRILERLEEFGTLQKQRFEDHIISGIKYRYIYNTQNSPNNNHPFYMVSRINLIGPSSIILSRLDLMKRNEDSKALTVGGIRYANFIRSDFDIRQHYKFTNEYVMAFRFFSGAGIPFDQFSVIPFDQLYFVGGANSIRGWQQRTLGPGGLFNPDNSVDRLGDIRLEFNTEFRFPITQIIKGALFIDAGNIWNINDENEITNFKYDTFYKQIAVASGIGVRLDFNFFLFRLDLGFPIKQPHEIGFWKFYYDQPNFNLGIGYPF